MYGMRTRTFPQLFISMFTSFFVSTNLTKSGNTSKNNPDGWITLASATADYIQLTATADYVSEFWAISTKVIRRKN